MAAIACPITLARVRRVIARIHPANSCGPDCLCIKLISALEEEMSKELVKTPTDYKTSTSTKPSGPATINGEPGLPERSTGGSGVPEVTYDRAAPLKGGQQK